MGSTKDSQINASGGDNFGEKYTMYIVRKGDYDNFWSTIVVNHKFARRFLFAIKAFNVEISQIRDRTKQDQLAVIRLQFWQDAIESIFTNTNFTYSGEPVLEEIQKCNDILKLRLSKQWLIKMVEARKSSFGLSNYPFNTVNEFDNYCDSTLCSANYIINEGLLTIKNDTNSQDNISLKLDHIGNHIGKSQGYANLVRGIIHNATHGRCYIPSELLAKHDVSHQDFLRVKNMDKIKDICFDIASISHQHFESAQKLANDSAIKPFYPAFLPLIPLKRFLTRLRKNNFDLANPTWGRSDPFLPVQALLKAKLWKFVRF